MSEAHPIYDSNAAFLSAFPDEMRPALHIIDQQGLTGPGRELLQLVASVADSEHATNVATLSRLPGEHRAAALEMLQFVLSEGLDPGERRRLLEFVELRLAALGSGFH